jgi:excisionase family DNA binding protein
MKDDQEFIRLLTVKQAARWLNISDRTLYNQIGPKAKKRFPVKPIRVGKSIRFDVEDLNRFIESQKQSKESK